MIRHSLVIALAFTVSMAMFGCEPEDEMVPHDTGGEDVMSDADASGDDVQADVADDADASVDTGPDPDRVVSVELTPTDLSMSVGDTEQLSVSATTAAGDEASTDDATIVSDALEVVEVSSGGFAIAKAVGQANVTASLEGVSDTILVTVEPRPLESVEVVPQNRTIGVGERFEMDVFLTDTSGAPADENYAVSWESEDASVLTIDSAGVVKGVSEGQTTVTASAGGLSDTANFTVEAPSVEVGSVEVTPAQANLFVGDTVQLSATIKDTGGNDLSDVSPGWASSNPAVATVDQSGLVRGVGDGQATIIASIAGVDDVSNITVDGTFSGITAGGAHSCALLGPNAYCWGANDAGQLGRGATNTVGDPAAVAGGIAFESLSAGGEHTCGVATSGDVYCWGSNEFGQLGDGTTTDRTEPVQVSSIRSVVAVSAGARHTCAVDLSNQLHCWGANESGQLGDGTTTGSHSPKNIAGNYASVTAGESHSCGFDDDGNATCWGANGHGQLGIDNTQPSLTPAGVLGGYAFSVFALGEGHTCGLTRSGAPACCGKNGLGQIGDGSTIQKTTPILIGINDTLASMNAGDNHTCALAAGGFVYCWGSNLLGQLGDGSTSNADAPQEVPTSLSFTGLAAGASHTCGIDDQGRAWCWGDGDKGQLGSGRAVETSPIQVTLN